MIQAPPVNATGESSATISPTLPPVISQETGTQARAQKRGGSGSVEKGGGSGWLPNLPNVQWEKRTDRPAVAAWHAPEGARAHRRTKTYLGYVGKRLLAEWSALPDDQRRAVVEQWVSERRREKGIG